MLQTINIRPATLNDAPAIAQVQVAVWHSAYRGLVPDAMIESMSVEDRTESWTTILTSFADTGRGACFVAEQDDAVVGFASCGAQRDDDLVAEFSGEISAIYVHEGHQRAGIGRKLMHACADCLAKMDMSGISLWVLSDNESARAFYAALGGDIITERVDNGPDGALSEVAYGWRVGRL